MITAIFACIVAAAIVAFVFIPSYFAEKNNYEEWDPEKEHTTDDPVVAPIVTPPLQANGVPGYYPVRSEFTHRSKAPRRVRRSSAPTPRYHRGTGIEADDLLDDLIYMWVFFGDLLWDDAFECDYYGVWGDAYDYDVVCFEHGTDYAFQADSTVVDEPAPVGTVVDADAYADTDEHPIVTETTPEPEAIFTPDPIVHEAVTHTPDPEPVRTWTPPPAPEPEPVRETSSYSGGGSSYSDSSSSYGGGSSYDGGSSDFGGDD